MKTPSIEVVSDIVFLNETTLTLGLKHLEKDYLIGKILELKSVCTGDLLLVLVLIDLKEAADSHGSDVFLS